MAQTITGTTGIESSAAFGDQTEGQVQQRIVEGDAGIASSVAFSPRTGVFKTPPQYGRFGSY